jgi:hypothetical protein
MAGTRAGALKGQQTIKDKYGVNEFGKSIMHSKAGTKSGKMKPSKPRGFAARPDLASSLGKIGGKKSRKKSL